MTTVLPAPAPAEAQPTAPPPSPAASRLRRLWRGRPQDPVWVRPTLLLITAVAAGLYTWGLSRNGNANSYYAAAVLSATKSWKAFLFGSLDTASFITVDKPPLALWVMALSGRVFGFSTWSMLLPEAIAGVASVLVLYHLVRRWTGPVAGLLAAGAFALTPISVAMFRYNNPDAVLVLLMLLGAWGIWSAVESGRTLPLVLAGMAVGGAFLAKMLQGFIVLPAFGLTYLICAKPRFWKRVWQMAVFTVTVFLTAGWWVALVELLPTGARPYVGGSTDNSVLNLIFGYNGLARVTGNSAGGPAGGPGGRGGGGPNFGGASGWLRMFNNEVGGQVSWLLPLAAVGLAAGLWFTWKRPRADRLRAGFVLWGLWTVVHVAVFSTQKGIFHPYYVVALAPGVAALAGAGGVALWKLGARSAYHRWLLPAAVLVTAWWAVVLLGRTPDFAPWLTPASYGAAVTAALAIGLGRSSARRWLGATAVAVGLASVMAGPAAYAVDTAIHSQSGALNAAGPSVAGNGPGGFLRGGGAVQGGANADSALISYLEANRGNTDWLVAVEGAQQAAQLILQTGGQPVMGMGGFSGDPTPTAAQLAALVSQGKLRFVIVGGGGAGGPGGGPGGGGARGDRTGRDQWVTANCQPVTTVSSGLYDCAA